MGLDPLQWFSWVIYINAAVLYSVFALVDSPLKKGGLIFTKLNARPIWMVIAIHLTFLIVLLELMRVATHIYPSLPNWLTNTLFTCYTGDVSAFDILFVLTMIAMYYIERRWIFVEAEDARHALSDKQES